ncbi:MAG: hypothetical protein R2777_03865 [Chitinophagales bacterium]
MISKNPKDEELFLWILLHRLGQLDKAYKNFDIATKIQPQYTGAYYMKGHVELMNNQRRSYKQLQSSFKIIT